MITLFLIYFPIFLFLTRFPKKKKFSSLILAFFTSKENWLKKKDVLREKIRRKRNKKKGMRTG